MSKGNIEYKKLIIEYFNERLEGDVKSIHTFMIDLPNKFNNRHRRQRIPSRNQIPNLIKSLGGIKNDGLWRLDIDKAIIRIP